MGRNRIASKIFFSFFSSSQIKKEGKKEEEAFASIVIRWGEKRKKERNMYV
jgi:hypothetical protein